MQAGEIELAPFAPHHLEGALALSRQAGWPHRLEDWKLVLSLSIGRVALADGRVVGTAFLTPYGDACATVNLVIVDQAMRGRGLGRRLMDFALRSTEGRECRLIATEDGLPLYEKLGFRRVHAISQHQGIPERISAPEGVEWALPEDITAVVALDRAAFGADRSALFAALAREGRFAVVRSEGAVAGFAALRPFGRGEVIGPVVAETQEQARTLIAFLIAARPSRFLRVDTPETSGLSPWLTELGLGSVGGGIAMRRGATASQASRVRTFALASQALG
jgi:GNAT superfamily N-acetyltransferase